MVLNDTLTLFRMGLLTLVKLQITAYCLFLPAINLHGPEHIPHVLLDPVTEYVVPHQ